jgi:hypothetical protein
VSVRPAAAAAAAAAAGGGAPVAGRACPPTAAAPKRVAQPRPAARRTAGADPGALRAAPPCRPPLGGLPLIPREVAASLAADAQLRKALQSSRRLGDQLLKSEQQEVQMVRQYAQELEAHFR